MVLAVEKASNPINGVALDLENVQIFGCRRLAFMTYGLHDAAGFTPGFLVVHRY